MIPIAGEEPIIEARLVDPGAPPPKAPTDEERRPSRPPSDASVLTDPQTPRFTSALALAIGSLGLLKLTLFSFGGVTAVTVGGIAFVLMHWFFIVWGATFIGNLRHGEPPELVE